MRIQRFYDLAKLLKPGKVLVVYGPRRVGKTTLLRDFLEQTKDTYKLDSGDNIRTQEILSSQDFPKILGYVEGYELLALDEAQQIPNIGMGLKIIVDQQPSMKIIATGSSSFDLANKIGEPLTGRKRTITLFPCAQMELTGLYNRFELDEKIVDFLVFGSYPEIIMAKTRQEKINILEEIVNSYLLKDILTLESIKAPQVLLKLLQLLAFQVGHEVSFNELARQLGVSRSTVERYLDLLEKTFIIIRFGAFSRNLRKEISKKQKYYFIDNGIRNGIISQFNGLESRNDVGQLWENFIISERLKKRSYKEIYGASYFWRTYGQQEIDLVEERDGKLYGYECKWPEDKNPRPPKDWQGSFEIISRKNYQDFIM